RRTCGEVMTKDPVFCLPGDTVNHVAQLMTTEDVGSIPVVENFQTRKLVGIVTDRDLAIQIVAEGRDPKGITVEEVMTKEPAACHAEDDLAQALEAMATYQVRRIPVVDANDQIIGIIAQADIATRIEAPEKTAEVVEEISKNVESE
ncbi:MAG: CBS domain-containing protein, partial [Candidatus Binatia bacterium]